MIAAARSIHKPHHRTDNSLHPYLSNNIAVMRNDEMVASRLTRCEIGSGGKRIRYMQVQDVKVSAKKSQRASLH